MLIRLCACAMAWGLIGVCAVLAAAESASSGSPAESVSPQKPAVAPPAAPARPGGLLPLLPGGASDAESAMEGKPTPALPAPAPSEGSAAPKPPVKPVGPRPRDPAAVDLAARIDRLLAEEVGPASATPAPLVGDAKFLRRIYLDFVGVIPSPQEIAAFQADSSPDKRAKVIDKLLLDARFGRNWSRYWRDVIMYHRTEDRAQLAAAPLASFLADELNRNSGWDRIAKALITATGDVQENGATGLIFAQSGKPDETVAEISRIFLGVQIQCAQCHDHPTDRWKREQFHELAAFFPRVAVRLDMSDDKRTFLVTVNDSPFGRGGNFGGNRFRGTAEHYMPDLNNPSARGRLMTPTFFVTGQKTPIGIRDADRRGKLADWITAPSDPWFAKAFVNRMWSELVGQGFYPVVDDIGPDRACLAPQTLDALAADFIASGYDIKRVFQTIALTTLYQRESRPRPSQGETPFQANVNQRLRADQIYDNLEAALNLEQAGVLGFRRFGGGRFGFRGPRFAFATTFGFDPSTPPDEIAGSIPQALALMNSSLLSSAISSRRSAVVGRLLVDHQDNDEVTRQLYLRILAREPTPSELVTVQNYVKEVGNRDLAFEDVAWALVNTSEFLYRN